MNPVFELTSQQLIERLAETGRVVEPRTLTDWRTKGLLPKLKGKGRGRGPGRLQYWDDPGVIGQAIILYDAMDGKRRAEFARWVLWFCGYDVDPDLVRSYWQQLLGRQHLSRDAEPGEIAADKYTSEITRLAEGLSKTEYFDPRMAEPVAREIIIATNEMPSGPMIEEEFEELFHAAQIFVERFKQEKKVDIPITEELLRDLLRLFRRFVSVAGLKRALKNVTADEMRRAQGYLRAGGSLLRALAVASQKGKIDEVQYLKIRRHFAPMLGRIIFEAILLIMKSGQEQILSSTKPIIAQINADLRRQIDDPQYSRSLQTQFVKLYSIFSDLEWKRLYKSEL